jgi:formylmethanofuran dehydrogenase subunit D
MYRVELQIVDDERVMIFPRAMLERMNVGEGDALYLFERDGEVILSANAPEPVEPGAPPP